MAKKTIIMGAHGGIGEALAKKLADQAKDLILTARDKATIEHLDGEKYSLDVTDTAAMEEFINTIDISDGLEGFVYAVGSIVMKPFKKTQDSDFINTFELNTVAALRALRCLEEGLKVGEGSVVMFSTVAARQGFPNHTVIAAAKGAIEAATLSLAAEWAPKVRVNAIAPSLTKSSISEFITSSDQMAKGVAGMHPISRLGEPEDCANMAAFLLSEDSSWITGQILHVDGGRSTLRVKG